MRLRLKSQDDHQNDGDVEWFLIFTAQDRAIALHTDKVNRFTMPIDEELIGRKAQSRAQLFQWES